MRIHRTASVILTCALLGACQDLTVLNKNVPSLDVSLSTASNIETTISAATKYWLAGGPLGNSINQQDGDRTFVAVLGNWNDEITYSRFTDAGPTRAMGEPPRAEFDHNAEAFKVNKAPWQDNYAAIVTCHDVRAAIEGGMKDAAFPQWQRANYYCKLIMGFAHLYIGALFDKGFVIADDKIRPLDETKYVNNWVPHDSIVEYSKTMIREGIEEAKAVPTTSTLTTWINGTAYTNVDMAKIAYGYLARAEIWKAATPEQREHKTKGGVVDWEKVLVYLDSSIESNWTIGTASPNFPPINTGGVTPGPNFASRGSTSNRIFRNAELYLLMGTNRTMRMHHKVLGPADTSGAYATFRRTPIFLRNDTVYSSPDRRLPRGPCIGGVAYGTGICQPRHVTTTTNGNYLGNRINADGNYFQLLHASQFQLLFNGEVQDPWLRASYHMIRFGASDAAKRLATSTTQGFVHTDFQPLMTPEEQNLMRAEAYMRLERDLPEAVRLINITRQLTTKGGLPPVTVNGVVEPYPRCVPKKFINAEECGDLWDALLWEKRMEQMGTDPYLNFIDWRGFGFLEEGTPVYFPPSYRESGQLGLPYYTYGGRLPGTVGSPFPCGSGTWQSIGCVNYPLRQRLPVPPDEF